MVALRKNAPAKHCQYKDSGVSMTFSAEGNWSLQEGKTFELTFLL